MLCGQWLRRLTPEVAALLAAATFTGRRVLEIGCGSGRLTQRYATSVRRAIGIDSDLDALTMATRECPTALTERVAFVHSGAATLPFRGDAFDLVLFAWSL